MDIIQELKAMRTSAQEMEQKLGRLIAEIERREAASRDGQTTQSRTDLLEDIYPLTTSPGFFKGRCPVGVIFADGVRIKTPTWKSVVETIMKRAAQDEHMNDALMGLRNRIQGKRRTLLGDSAEGMHSPAEIDHGLFMEMHYDAESLLRIMTSRILDVIGYDYQNIQVAVRKTNR